MTTSKNFFRASAEDFKKIPGSPVAYWVSERLRLAFGEQKLEDVCAPKQGLITGDNERFLRLWFEVSLSRFSINGSRIPKWFPFNKGGEFRKWFGNRDYVVNWERDGYEIKNFVDENGRLRSRPQNLNWNFNDAISWSLVTSGGFSVRYYDSSFMFNVAGISCFPSKDDMPFLLAFLNTKLANGITKIINPTINMNVGDVAKLPIINLSRELDNVNVKSNVTTCLGFSKMDWDSYETSWDFAANPLIAAWNWEREKAGDLSVEATSYDLPSDGTLQGIYEKVRAGWAANCEEMRRLETENNRIFIEAYGLQDELTPEVPWHEITLTCNPLYRYAVKNDELGIKNEELEKGRLPQVAKLEERLKADTVKELVSYAVGCMMGRYAIDKPGLVLANQGSTYEDYLAQISEPAFAPDDDGIIPILEDDCFADDIVTQFHRFLRITFGERNFNANLSFIEDALGKDLRSYFVKDFYADHLQRYQKRPIYWLFSSPKGTFLALIYLHRYHPGTVGQVLGYLRSHITKIQSRVDAADRTAADPAATQGMKTRAIKERAKLVRQLKELEDYERDVLHPLAGQRIEIDLDDGVKANYPKFGKALRKIPGLE